MSAPKNLQKTKLTIGDLKNQVSKFELNMPDFHNKSFNKEKQPDYLGLVKNDDLSEITEEIKKESEKAKIKKKEDPKD